MSLAAWITSIAVGIILYGGFAWCVVIAVRKGREEHDDAGRGSSEGR